MNVSRNGLKNIEDIRNNISKNTRSDPKEQKFA
jgi:hypothetical protein